jgi:hypothetical protein
MKPLRQQEEMADPALAPHTDQANAVTVGVRRRPENMTNA